MATITVNVADITGESAVVADHIDAFAISDFINSNGGGSASEVSEVQLHRYRDRASPHLAHACAAGTNLGEVEITLHVNGDDGLEPFYKCKLTQTYVSRIEHQTLDSSGNALKRHYGFSGGASETNHWGKATRLLHKSWHVIVTRTPTFRVANASQNSPCSIRPCHDCRPIASVAYPHQR